MHSTQITPQQLEDMRHRNELFLPPSGKLGGKTFFHPSAQGTPDSQLTHDDPRNLHPKKELPAARKELQGQPGHAHFLLDRGRKTGDRELSRMQKYPDGSITEHRGLTEQEYHKVNDLPPEERPEYFKSLTKQHDPPLSPKRSQQQQQQQHSEREKQNEWLPQQMRQQRGKQHQRQREGGSHQGEGSASEEEHQEGPSSGKKAKNKKKGKMKSGR